MNLRGKGCLHLRRRGELAEEAHVILEVVTEVVDLPLEHRDAFHAHAEGEAAVHLGVDAAGLGRSGPPCRSP